MRCPTPCRRWNHPPRRGPCGWSRCGVGAVVRPIDPSPRRSSGHFLGGLPFRPLFAPQHMASTLTRQTLRPLLGCALHRGMSTAAAAPNGEPPRFTHRGRTGVLQLCKGPGPSRRKFGQPAQRYSQLALDFFPLQPKPRDAPGRAQVQWSEGRSIYIGSGNIGAILHAVRARRPQQIQVNPLKTLSIEPAEDHTVDFRYTDADRTITVSVPKGGVAGIECVLEHFMEGVFQEGAPPRRRRPSRQRAPKAPEPEGQGEAAGAAAQ